MSRRWSLLIASTILVVILPTFVDAGWNRVQLPDGTQVCKDQATGVQFKPPYSAKADVTKSCNTLTSFIPFLGTAEAAPFRYSPVLCPDGTVSTAYLDGSCPPSGATLAWNDTTLMTALAAIALQSTGTATNLSLDAHITGSLAASATCALHTAVGHWSVTTSAGHCTLVNAGSNVESVALVLDLTASALTDSAGPFTLVYQAPPGADSLAPPIPTDLRTTASSTAITITGDTPWDACGNAVCKGVQDIQLQKDGSGTLATVTVGAGLSCNPTVTTVGTMGTTHSGTQTGNDWSVVSAGQILANFVDDSFVFVNCATSGAGQIVVQVTAISGASGTFREACVVRRESQSDPQSREIAGCVILDTDDATAFYYSGARLITGNDRVHLVGATSQAVLAACLKLAWDASNVHTFSTSTITGGKCNNDWSEKLSNYTMAFPTTNYVGLGATSNTGGSGTASTTSYGQFSINNLARWTYSDTTSGTHTYAAKARDKQAIPNASALSPTVSGTVVSAGTGIRWHPGIYGDCEQESPHTDTRFAIGNAADVALRACIDFYANSANVTGANVKGVHMIASLTSFEGNTAGDYSGTGATPMAAAGTWGFAYFDSILAYAASKGLRLIIGIQHYKSGAGGCGSGYAGFGVETFFPRPYLQSGCGGGTDTTNTYGVTLSTTYQARLWKAAWMDRIIAMSNAYGARYDSNTALEAISFFDEEANIVLDNGTDGFTVAGWNTQLIRLINSVRPAWPHTQLQVSIQWNDPFTPQLLAAMGGASNYIGEFSNDAILYLTSYGEKSYIGIGGAGDTHDYRAEIPHTVWPTVVESCDERRSKTPSDGNAANNWTPQEFYDVYYTLGKSDETVSPARPMNASKWIIGRSFGALCPTVANQQWGTTSSGGWYQFWRAHTVNTTCPSLYSAAGGCNTN